PADPGDERQPAQLRAGFRGADQYRCGGRCVLARGWDADGYAGGERRVHDGGRLDEGL
ncbi:hypothetical protein LTR66_012928, partial [Elasticomyces elasticus]